MSLERALAARRSVRAFSDESLDLAVLGQLMWAAQGITHATNRRTSPSAGALYPLEVYAVTDSQVLRYLPLGHRAQQWESPGARALVSSATTSREPVRAAPAAIIVAGVVTRTSAKYGSVAQRYVVLEAGHAAQNVCLQAVSLGLGSVTLGSLDPAGVSRALSAPQDEEAYYVIPVGVPAPGA
jgi:SagB-type dehydrogenase family enzyme